MSNSTINKPRENGLDLDVAEKEPCLDSDEKKDNVGRVDKLKASLALTRKGLVVLLVLLVLVVLFFLIIVILAALWPGRGSRDGHDMCRDPACFAISAELLRSVNHSGDACEDFWDYSCGGWIEQNPLPASKSRWDVYQEITFATRDKIRSLINTVPYPSESSSLSWKVRNFYESCMAEEYIETDRDKPIKDVIRSLGGWQILRELGTFDPLNWEFMRTLRVLHAEYKVDAFFRIEVAPDDRHPATNIIKIVPAGLGLPDRSFYYRRPDGIVAHAYKRYLKDVVQLMGVVSSKASQFAEEIFHFEKRIAEMTPSKEETRMPLQAYHRKTVKDLKKDAPSIPWRDILLAIYPKASVNEDTEILVVSPKFLVGVSRIISTSDRASLNNYLMWRLVNEYLPYLSSAFTDILDMYQKDLRGVAEPMPRWEKCVEVTRSVLGYAVGVMFARSMEDRDEAIARVEAVFEVVRDAVAEDLTGSPWFDNELRNSGINKIRTLEIQVGYPSQALHGSFLSRHYSTLTVQRSDFFRNILYGVRFQREVEQKKLLYPSGDSGWKPYLLKDRMSYIPTDNRIVVPDHILQEPLFHHQYTTPVLYGGFGTQLASLIVESIDEGNAMYNSDGQLVRNEDIRVNQSLKSMTFQKNCIFKYFLSKNLDSHAVLNHTSSDSVANIRALAEALKALEKSNEDTLRQPGMDEYSNEALFYLSYGRSLCSAVTRQQEDIERTMNFHLDNPARLRGTVMLSRSFTDAFQCSYSSNMYSSQSCGRAI